MFVLLNISKQCNLSRGYKGLETKSWSRYVAHVDAMCEVMTMPLKQLISSYCYSVLIPAVRGVLRQKGVLGTCVDLKGRFFYLSKSL